MEHVSPRTAAFALPAAGTRAGALVPFALGASVSAVAAEHGGYFPTSWGWTALALLGFSAAALFARPRLRLSRRELAFLGATIGFAAWIGLSTLWSLTPPGSVAEFERALVYAAAAVAFVLGLSRRSVPALLTGLLAGIVGVCGYALAARLFPSRFDTAGAIEAYRLSEPVGYWNGLALLAAIGALLAVGFAARGRAGQRSASAATLPLLLSTLYFTFGRAAWGALAAGLLAALAVERRRLQLVTTLVAVAPASALAVVLASRTEGLTNHQATLGAAQHAGQRFAVWLALLVAGSAASVGLLCQAERRVALGARSRRAVGAIVVAVVVAGVGGAVAAGGGPEHLARTAYGSFTRPPTRDEDLSRRLLTLSSDGRIGLWRVAWREVAAHPWLGGGAGSYELDWHAHRARLLDVRDAHSLYLETLAELGPVGLALLLLVVALPLTAARRARSQPLAAFALAAYVAFLVHAAADWDWELPALVLAALACGAAVMASARERGPRVRGRPLVAAALAAAAGFAAVGLVGNEAAATSEAALAAHHWRQAESSARKAARWERWSPRPWRLLGDARFGEGDFPGAARAYRTAVAKDPRDWQLWFDLSFALDGEPAADAAAHAAALDPLNPDVAEAVRAFSRRQANALERGSRPRRPLAMSKQSRSPAPDVTFDRKA